MKISNFKFLERIGNNPINWVDYADVDCTEGMLWWKTTRTRMVRKEYAGSWHFVDDGEWCPGYEVDALYRAAIAQDKQP